MLFRPKYINRSCPRRANNIRTPRVIIRRRRSRDRRESRAGSRWPRGVNARGFRPRDDGARFSAAALCPRLPAAGNTFYTVDGDNSQPRQSIKGRGRRGRVSPSLSRSLALRLSRLHSLSLSLSASAAVDATADSGRGNENGKKKKNGGKKSTAPLPGTDIVLCLYRKPSGGGAN